MTVVDSLSFASKVNGGANGANAVTGAGPQGPQGTPVQQQATGGANNQNTGGGNPAAGTMGPGGGPTPGGGDRPAGNNSGQNPPGANGGGPVPPNGSQQQQQPHQQQPQQTNGPQAQQQQQQPTAAQVAAAALVQNPQQQTAQGPAVGGTPAAQPIQASGAPPPSVSSVAPPSATSVSAAAAASAAVGLTSVPPPVGLHPVAIKAKDEILTSLHLIEDIRRLETYQRDFFLKVKESLNHVQQLLDHQLMDMAWSTNLIDCEESLLKASVHLSSSSPAQISELYGVLLADREKLSSRFNELSVKSSLSEFVVNSRCLLDIETVHGATDAILHNEKPILNKPDKSIPVDHTFFLANFCTTSVASSMLASFRPGTKTNNTPGTPGNVGMVGAASPSGSSGYHRGNMAPPSLSSPMYESKPKSSLDPTAKSVYYNASVSPGATSMGSPSAAGGIYNGSAVMAGAGGSALGGPGADDLANNVFGSHELVSAMGQITQQGSRTAGGPKPTKQDPWNKEILVGEEALRGPGNNGFGVGPEQTVVAGPPGTQHIVDGSTTESVTDESDDGRNAANNAAVLAAAAAAAGFQNVEFDQSKPLSFARIASLNLEKNSLQRITAAAAAAAAAGAQSPPAQMAAAAAAAAALGPHVGPNVCAPNLAHNLAHSVVSAQVPMSLPPPSLMSMAAIQQHQQQQLHHQQQQQQQHQHHQQHHHHPLSQPPGLVAPPMPMIRLPPSSNPRYFLDLVMEGKRLGRVIIEVQPAVAPKMADNFGKLVTHEHGYGYRDCQFFQAWRGESVITGDWEHNSGRGGRAALDGGSLFTPDETRLPCIRGAVGMRRMSKKHSSLNQVASQFRVILANMNTQFTGIFGHVIAGIEALDAVADIGGEGGRPEKVAAISNCGLYKA